MATRRVDSGRAIPGGRSTARMATAHQSGQTILVVEDDASVSQLIRLYLAQDGHQVITAMDGTEGLRLARERRPSLVVLDLMLPGIDGTEICSILRRESNVPIVMVTARVDEEDRLTGLDLGADDYITKPFSPRELAARVRAVLRRTTRDDEAAVGEQETIEIGGVVVDMMARRVMVDGNELQLTPTEFRLLTYFMRSAGRTVSREQIIEAVFGYDFDGFDRTVDTHISNLRRKLDAASDGGRPIKTVYGVGYRFDEE